MKKIDKVLKDLGQFYDFYKEIRAFRIVSPKPVMIGGNDISRISGSAIAAITDYRNNN